MVAQTVFKQVIWTCPYCGAQGGLAGTNYPPTTPFGFCLPLKESQSLTESKKFAHCSKCNWTGVLTDAKER